jgi:uncharacterized protein (DUF2225 family)
MGLSPEIWGRQGWHYIHIVALNYPEQPTEQDKKDYYNFFKYFQKTIPCPFCAIHFGENMKKIPIRLKDRDSLFKWTVDMHNEVNKATGKKVLTYEEAYDETDKNALYGLF